jgi:hypothetical protein
MKTSWPTLFSGLLAVGAALASPTNGLARLQSGADRLRQGDAAGALEEYRKLAKMEDALEHHRAEARQMIEELERSGSGQSSPTRASGGGRNAGLKPAVLLHVSPDGDDANPGTMAKPFASLERARDAVRALKHQGSLSSGGVRIEVRGGEYEVRETFRLEPGDSGTSEAPIVYAAATGERPRFRGGVRLTNWRRVGDGGAAERIPREHRRQVFEADLASAGAGANRILPLKLGGFGSGNGFRTHAAHELFFDGRALQLARGPNEGFLRITDVAVKDGTKGYDREGSKIGQFHYEGRYPERWLTEPDLLLYGYWFWDWADSYERVTGIEPSSRVITLVEPWHNYGYSIGAPFYAINALSELDTPGEWYLDRPGGRIFLYPPGAPGQAQIELSLLSTPMLRLDQVHHVAFERFTWELGAADAVVVRGGSHVLFAGCTIRHFAGNGLELNGGTDHGILSCDIYSLGRGGTVVSGGDRKSLSPGRHRVENCAIHDLSRIDHTYTPAILLSGVGNRVAHNRLHDVLSSALRVGGNDHLIEFNEIYNAVLESDDQGGADMYGNPTYRGNVYRFNYWHHIGNWRGEGDQPKCGQAGIRLDDAICGTLIYGNIFERCSAGKIGFGGVQIHGGKDNIIDSNLFVDCAAAVSFTPWSETRWNDSMSQALDASEVDRALYLQRYPDLNRLAQDANLNHVYRNVAVRCGELLRRAPKNVLTIANETLADGALTGDPADPLLNRPGHVRIPIDRTGLYGDGYREKIEKATGHAAEPK